MKTIIYDVKGTKSGEVALPAVFKTPYRPDVIKRAVLVQQSSARQPYGADPLAGKRTSAHYHGSRHYRFSMMNKETSRMPRIHGRSAGMYNFRARFAPHAVKGRRAHPPKSDKIWIRAINQKERQLALRSALAAGSSLTLVQERGHRTDVTPLIFNDAFEQLTKTKDVVAALTPIIPKELARCQIKKVRAGKGKTRGRKYRVKKGPLVITAGAAPVLKAARNIMGVDAVAAKDLNVVLLAPGAIAGRMLVMSEAAVQELQKRLMV